MLSAFNFILKVSIFHENHESCCMERKLIPNAVQKPVIKLQKHFRLIFIFDLLQVV